MVSKNTYQLLDLLPIETQKAVYVLSVPTLLTEQIATDLLQKSGAANGNPREIVNQIKRYPIWHNRNQFSWSFDNDIREVALERLNGSSEKTKIELVSILREGKKRIHFNTLTELKDYELQLARLELKLTNEMPFGVKVFRDHFDTALIFKNHETERVISSYLAESIHPVRERKEWPDYLLSLYFMRGMFAYRQKGDALPFLLPVCRFHSESHQSMHDAGIAFHLLGLIHSKTNSLFNEAESAYLKSMELRNKVNDMYGLAQVYHSLGNLYSKKSRETEYYTKAVDAYKMSLDIGTNIENNYRHLAQVYHSLGNHYTKHERFPEAEDAYKKSMEIERSKLNNKHGLLEVYHSLGNLYRKEGRFVEAEKAYKNSLKFTDANDWTALAQIWNSMGNLYSMEEKRYADAEMAYEKSLEIEHKRKNKYGLAKVYKEYGQFMIKKKDFNKAKQLLNESIKYENQKRYKDIILNLLKKLD